VLFREIETFNLDVIAQSLKLLFEEAYTSNAHGTLQRQYNTLQLWVGLCLG